MRAKQGNSGAIILQAKMHDEMRAPQQEKDAQEQNCIENLNLYENIGCW